jgi:tetraacyldisaccharide 4'-kinase
MRTIPRAITPLLYIPGLIFEAMIRVRGFLYSSSLIRQMRLPAPVISVGNLTAGGSGKTPLVVYIARRILELKMNPVILSRGYGRQSPGRTWILPPGTVAPSPARILGDEPALMRRHLPSAWMGISKSRFKAGTTIARECDRAVFVLDDGFQHRKLHRDLDLVVVDQSQALSSNRIIPRGTLREPLSELRRSHWIVINGAPETEKANRLESEIQSLHEEARIFFCTQTIKCLIPFSAWLQNQHASASQEAPRTAFLVSALGNPDRFDRDIRQLGIEIRGRRCFSDHYWLKDKDWFQCTQEARTLSVDAMITTEKDAVKIARAPDFPLLVAVQSTQISDASAFDLGLKKSLEGGS